jgi:hypothetical protein
MNSSKNKVLIYFHYNNNKSNIKGKRNKNKHNPQKGNKPYYKNFYNFKAKTKTQIHQNYQNYHNNKNI